MADKTHWGFSGYHTLMRERVGNVLLVASPYDSFVLEEDGQFSDRIFRHYLELNLTNSPRFNHVSTLRAARAELRQRSYDLVICTPNGGDVAPPRMAAALKEVADIPVVLLSYDRYTAQTYVSQLADSPLDEVFLWTGGPGTLLGLVKSAEDRLNVDRDTRKSGTRVILVVEDSPAFYSAYLPVIYGEVFAQTMSLMPNVLNPAHRMYRMRARPKILLAHTYEQARALMKKYQQYLLGVVMDMEFPRKGRLDPKAGLASTRMLRKRLPDMPVLIQSNEDHSQVAREIGAAFAHKQSPQLLEKLRHFMWNYLGFGEFVWRLPDGSVVDHAEDITDMLRTLRSIPGDSLAFHGARNHISNWLMARTEFELASQMATISIDDFETQEHARTYIVDAFSEFLESRQRGKVTDWTPGADPLERDFTRIGGGSMGGKARGVAFTTSQLAHHPIHEKYPDITIEVPRTIVLCTEIFDRFIDRYDLRHRAMEANSDEEICRLFLSCPLDEELHSDLEAILSNVRYPLAVRSSSLFEDSAFEPLAGMYQTLFVPNSSPSPELRLEQLSRAIRLVFASTFFLGPRATMEAGALRIEEEKMAVIVQRLAGDRHGDRFYPHFAGVAQSHNYYPIRYLKTEEGVIAACLGLGQQVVEGGRCYRYCPAHPNVELQFAATKDALRHTQRQFFALDMSDPNHLIDPSATTSLDRYDLSVAEEDGVLAAVGATYSAQDDRIVDTIYKPGVRIVNFAQVRKYGRFPLSELITDLLEMGNKGLSSPVEMEFAVSLDGPDKRARIAVLQLRALAGRQQVGEVDIGAPSEDLLLAGPCMGNGIVSAIQDVVYLNPERFDPADTRNAAREVARINARLKGRPYLLMGPGRWGTADPHLGIPVLWSQVNGAAAMVELPMPGRRIEPSQGTHFFHNITSLHVPYFTLDPGYGRQSECSLDMPALEAIKATHDERYTRHVELSTPIEVRVDGRTGRGIAVWLRSAR